MNPNKNCEDRVGIPCGMVRVISCHHFSSQDVFLSENEPVAFGTAQERLLVATVQHTIEIRDLDRRGHIIHSFPTVDQVKQIIYCESGNYIGTLEKKTSRYSEPVTYVRAYLNWWIDMKTQPMKVRIAGCVTPNCQSGVGGGQLEMIEFPLDETALCIGCCKKNATFAVSLGKIIRVYCFSSKTHDISKQNFHDFDLLMTIHLSFPVHELGLCEDYFACLSINQVHVFRLSFQKRDDDSTDSDKNRLNAAHAKESSNSNDDPCIVQDENHVEWCFESCTQNATADTEWENHLKEVLHPKSFPITLHLHSIDVANQRRDIVVHPQEVRGPIVTVPGVSVQVHLDSKSLEPWPDLISSKVHVITLIYRQFDLSSEHGNALQGLHLLPFYLTASDLKAAVDPLRAVVSKESSFASVTSPLHSRYCPQLKGLSLFFSAPQEGFLYDLISKTELVSHYPYTAAMKSVALEPELLHVLTETGLETYTMRICHRAVIHSENVDGVRNACPDSEEAVCLLGLRPFLGVEQLFMSDRHLILVSSMDDSYSSTESVEGSGCTLYSLKKPTPQQLFSDLLETANFHKSSSPPTYIHLLSEGHIILRSYLLLNEKQHHDPEIKELYNRSCALMGDHFIGSELALDRYLSVPYYTMSQLPVEQVVQRVLELRNQVKHPNHVLKTLVKYLDFHLYRNPEKLCAIPQSVAETILEIYAEESPDNLWKVLLLSGMKTYKIEKAILLLKRKMTSKKSPLSPVSSGPDTVAIVDLLLRKGNTETAQNMFLSLSKGDLVPVLVDIHSLLWNQLALTNFGQVTKHIRPDAFIEVLLSLINKGTMTPQEAVLLLQKDNSTPDIYTTPLLKEYLESLLTDKKYSSHADWDIVVLLVKIYLFRIKKGPAKSSITNTGATRSANLFGNRYLWLNETLPFNGNAIAKTCILNGKNSKGYDNDDEHFCPCWNCNEDLLRLQSLLCSSLVTPKALSHLQELFFSQGPTLRGYLSLLVLCSEISQALSLLLKRCIPAVLPFALETFDNNQEKWCLLFKLLQQILFREETKDDPNYSLYLQTFQGVLSHMAEILHPTVFVNILPKENKELFLQHLKRCSEKHQSEQLREKIVALGTEIKAMM